MEENKVQLVVDGMTGAGKTTLVDILSRELDLLYFEEVFRDKYDLLGKFFADRQKYCLPMQLSFLNNRFNQYLEAARLKKAIMDRSIFSDQIFARMYREQGYLGEEEYYVYENLCRTLLEQVTPPVIMVYLKVSTPEAVRRIHQRGREDEVQVEYDYWDKLNAFYEENYQGYDKSPLLTLDVTELDFSTRRDHREQVVSQVRQSLRECREGDPAAVSHR